MGQGGGANGGERELQTRSIASSIALRLSVVDEAKGERERYIEGGGEEKVLIITHA